MIQLVLDFYIPAFLITFLLAVVISGIHLLFYASGNRAKQQDSRKHMFDLMILNLLTIPVASFAVLAILVIFKAR